MTDNIYAEAFDNYTYVHTLQQRFLISTTLKNVELKLNSKGFIRTHRSFLANLTHLTAVEDGNLFFGEKKVPVGRTFKEEVYKNINTF